MSEYILVWVMVSAYQGLQYSPPVKTLEDCQRIQEAVNKMSLGRTVCVQVNMLRKAQEK
jgi:hypothetical protein